MHLHLATTVAAAAICNLFMLCQATSSANDIETSTSSLVQAESALAGKTIVPAEWIVQAIPGGEKLKLTGTVEKVYHELLAINPNYDADWGVADVNATTVSASDSLITPLTDFTGASWNCRGRWAEAIWQDIEKGLTYLSKLNGQPHLGPGPGRCSQVSCSYGAAITWCNDARTDKTLASWGSIIDGANYIYPRCVRLTDPYLFVGGQAFHKTDWNVIVSFVGYNNC